MVRWQSGSRFSVTTGVDNALSGVGGQRAVQVMDNVYGDRSVSNYLNAAAYCVPTICLPDNMCLEFVPVDAGP